jgi:hypothetical protein
MKVVRTPEGSTNPIIQLTSLGDPSGVGYSSNCVDRCPRACARGYLLVSPFGARELHRMRDRI